MDIGKYTITNIHRGSNERRHVIYAELRDEKGELLMGATMEYILAHIRQMTKDEGIKQNKSLSIMATLLFAVFAISGCVTNQDDSTKYSWPAVQRLQQIGVVSNIIGVSSNIVLYLDPETGFIYSKRPEIQK